MSEFVEFQLYKYPFLRHIYRKSRPMPYGFYSNESYHDRYLRQKEARLLRRFILENDEEAKEFFNWIWEIQRKLNWSNVRFASEIGVSLQCLKLWRNFHGHYPSQKSLHKLLELDRIASICTTRKIVYGITTSRLILK